MNYELKLSGDRVRYIRRDAQGSVGSDTTKDRAQWILNNGKVSRSEDYPEYPIRVEVGDEVSYYLAGAWLMGGEKDILTDEPKKRKRRIKDEVCE